MTIFGTLGELVDQIIISDIKIAIGGAAFFLKPMEIIREIIRQKKRNLKIITLIGDLDIDLLIGVKAIKELDSCYVGLPMIGMARNFRNAIEKDKDLLFREWSELSMVRAFQAGAMGVPFVTIRSLLGSDLVKVREDFHEIDYKGKKYIQIPALSPDLALIHAYAADVNGNIYYQEGHVLDEFSTLPALSSNKLFVTVEKFITEEEGRKINTQIMFSYLDVDYIAKAPNGAYPTGFPPIYSGDMGHIMTYSGMIMSSEGFQEYLNKNVLRKEA